MRAAVFRQPKAVHEFYGLAAFADKNLFHLHLASGEGSGLVEHHCFHPAQHVQILAALEDDALFGRHADADVIGKRDGNHQRAGAGNDEENQAAPEPDGSRMSKYCGDEEDQDGDADHNRGIDPGEAGDEFLLLRFACAGVFDQVQDAGHGAFRLAAGHLDLQSAAVVQESGEDFRAGVHIKRLCLAGESGSVNRAFALQDHAVERDPFARIDDDGCAHRHFSQAGFHHSGSGFEVGLIRFE